MNSCNRGLEASERRGPQRIILSIMRKTKKPAIASEWRENQKALDRADKKAASARRQAERSHAASGLGGLMKRTFASVGWVAALTLGALLALSLLSYSPLDPGFSVTGVSKPDNICGLFGAWSADLLYWLFGCSSWWLVCSLVVFGIQFVRYNWAQSNSVTINLRPVTSIAGLLMLMTASVGLESLQFGYLSNSLPMGAGGLCGQYMAKAFAPYIGVWGATIVFVIMVAAGMAIVFNFSWFGVAERIGALVERIVKTLVSNRTQEPKKTEKGEPSDQVSPGVAISQEPKRVIVNGPVRKVKPSERAVDAQQPELFPKEKEDGRKLPSLAQLDLPPNERVGISEDSVKITSRMIESKLKTYRIDAEVVGTQAGPVITQYWLNLAEGVKGSRVEDIRKDLTRALAVPSVRVVPVIPGKPYMGLEIPNSLNERMAVYLREIIGSEDYEKSKSALSLALGKDIAGKPVVVDLAKMPHLLVGGTTGSGKSVAINTMILSLLFKSDPDHLRLVLIDPKTVEFSLYQDIPHLLCPVVTDMNKASNALAWLVAEMDRRYNLMSKLGVRSFDSFNDKVEVALKSGRPIMDPFSATPEMPEPNVPLKPFPYIVCFIDELADLILVNRKQVEMHIMRLAQKARAAGIHLVLATQRPSVDIVTPLIKANIVARVCFQVASRFDSQVVLDEGGAQDLLGKGDMLFRKPGMNALQRIQGCMVDEREILRVVDELKSMGEPEYVDAVTETQSTGPGGSAGTAGGRNGEKDPLYDEAVQLVLEQRRASTSFVQRRFSIGYNRAANLLESMEAAGIVSKANAAGKREILVKEEGGIR